jgi:signal peptidase II
VFKRQVLTARIAPLIAAALVVVGDRLSKDAIERSINSFDAISIIPSWLRLIHTENAGAAFGVLSEGAHPLLRSALLIGVSGLVLLYVASALWSRASSYASTTTRFALGLILGGALGNMYDRVVHGSVTDFIEVYHGAWSFPAFNVADSAITVGAILLLFDLLRPRRKRVEEEAGFAHK